MSEERDETWSPRGSKSLRQENQELRGKLIEYLLLVQQLEAEIARLKEPPVKNVAVKGDRRQHAVSGPGGAGR